jgi:hypothetical protein
MLSSQDVNRLALCLDKLPPVDDSYVTKSATAPEKLLDCVLSLHRRYDEFAFPRIKNFKNTHPNINTLLSLCQCVAKCGGPARFYENELNYNYPDAAEMFGRVLDYLTREINKYPGNTETEKCRNWAVSVSVDGYQVIWRGRNIPLFGIAGWQYLRMLFGADTCKPDIAVKRFVKDCLKKDFSARSIVELMERAAPLAPALKSFSQPVHEADRRIWHQYNNRKNQSKSACR